MHEISLVRTLLEQVDRLAAENDAAGVDEVRIQVGPLSGVEPVFVANAFEMLAVGSRWAQARLVIQEMPLAGCCRGCGEQFEIVNYHFRCPTCDGSDVVVTQGDGFILDSITIRQGGLTGAVHA